MSEENKILEFVISPFKFDCKIYGGTIDKRKNIIYYKYKTKDLIDSSKDGYVIYGKSEGGNYYPPQWEILGELISEKELSVGEIRKKINPNDEICSFFIKHKGIEYDMVKNIYGKFYRSKIL